MRSIVANIRSPRLQADLNCGEIAFDRYVVRADRRQLLRNGEPVALNGKAVDLLLVFLDSGGRVLTRDDL
jgi:DNA-binding winged helix-turn-helix (wHTH) protein